MFSALLSFLSANVLLFILHIDGSSSFPKPLSAKEERAVLERLQDGDPAARATLIERNLRLVSHIVKKYYSRTNDTEDLVSIGTIGLIKAIDSFDPSKGTRLATYASRCIENEILMYFRAQRKTSGEVHLGDAIEIDKDGNPLTLQDVIRDERDMEQELEQQVVDLEKFHNTADGRVQVWFGLRTIFNNTDELCVRTKELADKYGVGIHMHVAEAKEEKEYTYARWGEGTVKHLERLGVLDKNLLAVHTVWLTDEELELFKKREVKISHNPASAMRVLGFARIPKMLAMGLRPSIGTDGASSSNHMDMVDEMWLTSLIHKGWRLDPTVVPSQDILRMATKWGARALLDEDLYGSLECGKKADLIVIDPHGPSMMPVNDKIAALVTAMHSANIQSTMCDGKWLMRDRKILTLDEEAILKEACDRAKAIYKRAGIELPDRFPVVKV